MQVREASLSDLESWLSMAATLWPDDPAPVLTDEFRQALEDDEQVCYICSVDGTDAGFVTASLRHEHVPGADSRPAGYLEGLFVHEQFRRRGLARALTEQAEAWARARGCTEMGSDTWDWNKDSERFHNSVGYGTYETLIHFIKKL